jgi:hypothetical protein
VVVVAAELCELEVGKDFSSKFDIAGERGLDWRGIVCCYWWSNEREKEAPNRSKKQDQKYGE